MTADTLYRIASRIERGITDHTDADALAAIAEAAQANERQSPQQRLTVLLAAVDDCRREIDAAWDGNTEQPLVDRLQDRAYNGIMPMHELARLDMLAAAAEIRRLGNQRRSLHLEIEAIKARVNSSRLDSMRDLIKQGWTAPKA